MHLLETLLSVLSAFLEMGSLGPVAVLFLTWEEPFYSPAHGARGPTVSPSSPPPVSRVLTIAILVGVTRVLLWFFVSLGNRRSSHMLFPELTRTDSCLWGTFLGVRLSDQRTCAFFF